jgi:hypothetical protein
MIEPSKPVPMSIVLLTRLFVVGYSPHNRLLLFRMSLYRSWVRPSSTRWKISSLAYPWSTGSQIFVLGTCPERCRRTVLLRVLSLLRSRFENWVPWEFDFLTVWMLRPELKYNYKLARQTSGESNEYNQRVALESASKATSFIYCRPYWWYIRKIRKKSYFVPKLPEPVLVWLLVWYTLL